MFTPTTDGEQRNDKGLQDRGYASIMRSGRQIQYHNRIIHPTETDIVTEQRIARGMALTVFASNRYGSVKYRVYRKYQIYVY